MENFKYGGHAILCGRAFEDLKIKLLITLMLFSPLLLVVFRKFKYY